VNELFLRDISQQWYTLDYLFGSVAVLSISLVLPSFTAFDKHIREAVMQKHWDRVITPQFWNLNEHNLYLKGLWQAGYKRLLDITKWPCHVF